MLINPNNEFPLNYVPLRTLAAFVHAEGAWDARQAYLTAMREWLPQFATVGQPVALADLILFGDCYYLPHEEGAEAEAFYQCTLAAFNGNHVASDDQPVAFRSVAARLREFCVRLTELRDRPLFYALSRRIWELREELDLLERYVGGKSESANHNVSCTSDFHLPGTYRGGMVARLQRLLIQRPDGTFEFP